MDLVKHLFSIKLRWRWRGVDDRNGVLIQGPSGWGEFSPFPNYGPSIAARWLRAALEAATGEWPRPVRTRIPVNVTIPAVGPQEAHDLVVGSGCKTAKVKVGDPGDIERVEAVRDALGIRGKVRVDANGVWDVDTAAKRLRTMNVSQLEYAEQPVSRLSDMIKLRRLTDVPLAVDESLRTAPDPLHIKGLREGADLLVLKVQPLGGVGPALRIAEAYDLPCVVSSAIETSVGTAAGLALAAALPDLRFACGLGTVTMLQDDVVKESLVPKNGVVVFRRPEIDEGALERVAPGTKETVAITRRFESAAAYLERS